MNKFLLAACIPILFAVGVMGGYLIASNLPKQENPTINPTKENTTSTVSDIGQNPQTNTRRSTEWNVSFCPYCGAPFDRVEEIPRYIDANGIMHGDIYRIYECGHRVYMGEKTWRFYNFKPEVQEYYREYIKERGGEVYY